MEENPTAGPERQPSPPILPLTVPVPPGYGDPPPERIAEVLDQLVADLNRRGVLQRRHANEQREQERTPYRECEECGRPALAVPWRSGAWLCEVHFTGEEYAYQEANADDERTGRADWCDDCRRPQFLIGTLAPDERGRLVCRDCALSVKGPGRAARLSAPAPAPAPTAAPRTRQSATHGLECHGCHGCPPRCTFRERLALALHDWDANPKNADINAPDQESIAERLGRSDTSTIRRNLTRHHLPRWRELTRRWSTEKCTVICTVPCTVCTDGRGSDAR
jgi:hypothetical protein